MRICLTTTYYPPKDMGGIPRQRHILAHALAKQGHEVHVIIQGKAPDSSFWDKIHLHTVPLVKEPFVFSAKYPALNHRLTHSLAIQEQIRVLNQEKPLDILDVPLWNLEGFIPICANETPTVLWLQTSFAQLVALDGRNPQGNDIGVIGLEKESLKRAQGIIADSQTVLTDFERVYNLKELSARSRVVRLGIPDLPARRRIKHEERNTIEALLVGRLEKRKGTPFLFEIIPQVLSTEKHLRVRFIGADNSHWDGFFTKNQQTYPEYFYTRWPGLRNRVIFEGSVSENRLIEAYNQADLMLIPSLYESFGLIYLEAMRSSLPIITFALGAAPEIFPRGESDGALLVPPGDGKAFLTGIQDLAANGMRRKELGDCGRERFLAAFLDTRMAEETAAYYQEIIGSNPQPKAPKPRRIFQVMEAMVIGDAVTKITLKNADLFHEMGVGGSILSVHASPQLANKVYPVDQFDSGANAALIYHYWNYSHLEDFIRNFQGPKAIHFHNITPPEFFSPEAPGYEATSRGYEQLPGMINLFDLLIGDSSYNLEVCRPFLNGPKPAIVVPPVVEAEEVRARPYDAALLERLRKQEGTKLLFVGRIAPNKRQDRLIELLEAFSQSVDRRARLYLVGSEVGDLQYQSKLAAQCERLPSKDRIVFTGKVSDEVLYSYYRAADIFVCASEHEGFCVPVIEAMALDVPVLAYAASAVPETMGEAGILVKEWDPGQIAQEIQQVMKVKEAREEFLERQRENLLRFNTSTVKVRLMAVVRFLQGLEVSDPFIEIIKPSPN